jgi:hypothetical protein
MIPFATLDAGEPSGQALLQHIVLNVNFNSLSDLKATLAKDPIELLGLDPRSRKPIQNIISVRVTSVHMVNNNFDSNMVWHQSASIHVSRGRFPEWTFGCNFIAQ